MQSKKGQSLPSVSLIIVCQQLGGNVAAATELAGSTKAVAGCQQRVEAKTRHLHNHYHNDNSEEVGGDINDDDDDDDDDNNDDDDDDDGDNDDEDDDDDDDDDDDGDDDDYAIMMTMTIMTIMTMRPQCRWQITKTARSERPSQRLPRWPSLGSQVQMSSSVEENV